MVLYELKKNAYKKAGKHLNPKPAICLILCCMRKVEQFMVNISFKSLNYDLYEEMKTPGGEFLSRNK